ncbi:MAG: isoprenyl transferase [Endomicrobiia bacterium]
MENLPKHIAIIMDGNGRWAKKRNLPRVFGHRAGIKAVRQTIEACREIGIPYLSLYAFSTENWQRPKTEIKTLMNLLYKYLKKEKENLKKNDIKLIISGDISALPKIVQKEIKNVTEYTKDCKKMVLNLCLNYGSRQEIINAINKIISKKYSSVNEAIISKNLYTKDLPDPDLLIRTSGEFRISNFMLWQIAYTELYFTDVLWPDFSKEELYKAIQSYQKRERRFGKV